jgi:hypothetical protein
MPTDCTCSPLVMHQDDCAVFRDTTVLVTTPTGQKFRVFREPLLALPEDQ